MSSGAIIAMRKKYRKKVDKKACEIVAESLIDVLEEFNVKDIELIENIRNEKDIEELKKYIKFIAKQNIQELKDYIKNKD